MRERHRANTVTGDPSRSFRDQTTEAHVHILAFYSVQIFSSLFIPSESLALVASRLWDANSNVLFFFSTGIVKYLYVESYCSSASCNSFPRLRKTKPAVSKRYANSIPLISYFSEREKETVRRWDGETEGRTDGQTERWRDRDKEREKFQNFHLISGDVKERKKKIAPAAFKCITVLLCRINYIYWIPKWRKLISMLVIPDPRLINYKVL